MNAPISLAPQTVMLSAPDDFAGWRHASRMLLAAGVPPQRIDWQVEGEAATDLFAMDNAMVLPRSAEADAGIRVPRALLVLLRTALLHSDPGRFALGYRLLWRLRRAPELHADPADPDVIALAALARAVRRDIHKMHAFVRFRKVGEAGGREQFAAWFEPQHHIGRAVAGFFRDRFAGMEWLIVTPEISIAWDGSALREGPGGTRADVPEDDAVEAEWRTYYSSIFNPARLKIAAMKREMPVRYWRNLPEAALISGLIEDAERRVEAMVKAKAQSEMPLFAAEEEAEPERHFESLKALYAALRKEDDPPPGFSEHLVTGEGPDGAAIMLVGEQPGDQEDIEGRPFVGPAGQLLDGCLEEAGIDRGRLFLTNAVKRFKFTPPGQAPSTPDAYRRRHRPLSLVAGRGGASGQSRAGRGAWRNGVARAHRQASAAQ